MEQKYITLILLKIKKVTFWVFSIFLTIHKQHKCDPQMNNTRGLIPPKFKQLSSQYDVILLRPLPRPLTYCPVLAYFHPHPEVCNFLCV